MSRARGGGGQGRPRGPVGLAAIALLVAELGGGGLAGSPLAAQRVAVDGLANVEAWQTDAGSRLLARNDGRAAFAAELYGWTLVRPWQRLELAAIGYAYGGSAEEDDGAAALELLEARVLVSPALMLHGGRVLMPAGSFGARRFPHTNPLIGAPDLYPPQYPWGVVAEGQLGPVDYRAAAVSLPQVNPSYSPAPSHRLRPVVGAGLTLGPALHVGASWTHGPYLGTSSEPALPAGSAWDDYQQTVVAATVRVSVGYVETRVEAAWSSYDVPTKTEPVTGVGFYVEPRVTLSPRLFAAARLEWFDYAFIRAFGTNWTGRRTLQQNGEVGLGYRYSPGALAKVSARRDNWPGPDPSPNFHAPNGYAFALQFSRQFSLTPFLAR